MNPAFISVTYGRGGGTSKKYGKDRVSYQRRSECIESCPSYLRFIYKGRGAPGYRELKKTGIENILALRGDILPGIRFPDETSFRYAYELVEEIHKHGDFCVGAACYPEGHVENEHKADDIRYLNRKWTAVWIF